MKRNAIDRLIERIDAFQNPSVAGIDTDLKYLPEADIAKCRTLKAAADAILEFNRNIIDGLSTVVPAVKVQAAYYERYGVNGMRVFARTLAYARSKGMITIADVKRNDIGSTASAYSSGYLGRVSVNGKDIKPDFDSDFITVNGYLGSDGLKPFIDDCQKYGKGIFVLVKTSNPSSGELQDAGLAGGETVYEKMGASASALGAPLKGKYGYSPVGAVVGATHPAQAEVLRNKYPALYFLVPGYGAQGGTAADLLPCFDGKGRGAIVNSSRGILCAYKSARYAGLDYAAAAARAACDMRDDITSALKSAGKW
jgi:orotidine-5'-phosphate decarboxylase